MNLRVLLATDLSPGAAVAARLVNALAWPSATAIRVLGVVEPSLVTGGDEGNEQSTRELIKAVRATAEPLVTRDRVIEAVTRLGVPAEAIVDEATSFHADLVVVGSRGRGPVRTALLGSVSAAVVDQAPCPVLIARRETISGIVFGTDGATHTAEAARVLAWPVFARFPVKVVTVSDIQRPIGAVTESREQFERAVRAYLKESNDNEDRCARIANEQAAALAKLGIEATGEMRRGSPAKALIAAAATHGADLIVAGSRGDRGVRRMLVGSTARELLHHAPCSVLIARGVVAVEPVREALALGWHASAVGA